MNHAVAEFCASETPPAEPPLLGRPRTSARGDLRAIMGDGVACSVMIGIGENYLAPFALALGMGELVAGLITSVPLLVGAVLQMISPMAIRRLGSHRRWVVACVVCQAVSFLPLAIAAAVGKIPVAVLFLMAAIYWGSGMASGPAWSTWVDTLIPERIRASYFGRRARLGQAGTLIGFAGGGLWLQFGESRGSPMAAFATLFVVAALCRSVSALLLSGQSECRRSIEPRRPPTAVVEKSVVFRSAKVRPFAERKTTISANGTAAPLTGGLLRRLRHEGDGRLLVYLWAMQAAAQVASPYFAPFMLVELNFSYAKYMLIVSISLMAKAVALPTLGALAQRFGALRLLWVGGLIVIPLPAFWMISQAAPMLLMIQIMAGVSWATYELAAFLLFFEAIDARERIGMLTIYNLGNAAATVAGSLIGGGILMLLGESHAGYLAVFAASGLARGLTVPLLRRVRDSVASPARQTRPATVLFPTAAGGEERPLSRAA